MILRKKIESREEWLAERKKSIGGSEAGSVVGMNPYRSAYTLWAEKTGRIPEFEGNLTTTVGAYLEDLVAHLFEEETGKKVRRENYILYNEKYPFAHATIDRRVIGEDAILEIKTTNSIPIMRAIRGSDEFVEAYYAQCVHYLAVTECKVCYLAVLINCRELKIYTLKRDEDEIAALMNAEKEFWTEFVEKNVPPAPDGSDSTSETVAALYPDSDGSECDLTAYEQWLEERMILDHQISDLKRLKDEADNRVKDYMMASVRGESPHYKVSWVEQTRSTFDKTAFQIDNPEIDLEKYYKKTKSRVFKVTMKKENNIEI